MRIKIKEISYFANMVYLFIVVGYIILPLILQFSLQLQDLPLYLIGYVIIYAPAIYLVTWATVFIIHLINHYLQRSFSSQVVFLFMFVLLLVVIFISKYFRLIEFDDNQSLSEVANFAHLIIFLLILYLIQDKKYSIPQKVENKE